MKINRAATSLLTGLALAATLPLAAVAQSRTDTDYTKQNQLTTQFRCVWSNEGPATVATRGNRQSPPFIIWQTGEFGPEYTPQRRCEIVSQRLNRAVRSSGSAFQNLHLTYGEVNGRVVVCVADRWGGSCNSNNMLVTLREDNARNPGQFLTQMEALAHGRTGADPVYESGGGATYINLSDMLEPSLGSSSSGSSSPSYQQHDDIQGW